ncbi:hypothetical protein, unknown function [Leishmania tarentolae]|uniref:Uncharacterized protein n=1 Tax=Leishmania tarentolae TaxID=5689 RepID=A0A640KX23_LEITA|nr:hypothetical protein, unknown function [Leishmania tarentolae]
MESSGASSSQNASKILKADMHNTCSMQDIFADFTKDDSDSDARSGEKTEHTVYFMHDCDDFSGGSCSSWKTTKDTYSYTTLDDMSTQPYGECEEGKQDRGDEESEALCSDRDSLSRAGSERNIQATFGVSPNSISSEQGSHVNHFSVSGLLPATISRAALPPKLNVSLTLSGSGTLNNLPSKPPAEERMSMSRNECDRSLTRLSQSPPKSNSRWFSQIDASMASETYEAQGRASVDMDRVYDRNNGELPTSFCSDEKGHCTISMMHMGSMLQGYTHSNAARHNEGSVTSDSCGFWTEDDEKSKEKMPSQALASKKNGTLPSFLRYSDAGSQCILSEESKSACDGAKQSDEQLRMSADGSYHGPGDDRSNSTDDLLRSSSSVLTGPCGPGNPPDDVFLSGKEMPPNVAVRVLRGDFDNRDASLDSRFLDDNTHNTIWSTSKEAQRPLRQIPTSSRHVVNAGCATDRQGTRAAVAGVSRTLSGRLVEEPVRRQPSSNGSLGVCRVSSFSHPRESFLVARSLSCSQANSLPSVPSQQTLVSAWQLLRFREQDDAPLTNIEHVARKGASKKRSKDKKKKSKKHGKHRRPCHSAECGHVGVDSRNIVGKGEDVNRDDGFNDDAAGMCKERNTMRVPAGLPGMSAAGNAPGVPLTDATLYRPSTPPGSIGATETQGGPQSDVTTNGQPMDRHQGRPRGLSMGGSPTEKNAPPSAENAKIGVLHSRTPLRTVCVTPSIPTALQAHNSSAEKSTGSAVNARVPHTPSTGLVHAVGDGRVNAAPKPKRFETFEEPPVVSPSATVRRVTVCSKKSKTSMDRVDECNTRSDSDGGAQRFRSAPCTQVLPSVSSPNWGLPTSRSNGLASQKDEPPLQSGTRAPEGLPPL